MVKPFEVVVFKTKSLEVVRKGIIIEALTLEEARKTAITRYQKDNLVAGVQAVKKQVNVYPKMV